MSEKLPEPAQSTGYLPGWTSSGALPVGDYWPTKDDFERRLVNVEGSKRRPIIYDGWKRHRAALMRAGCDAESKVLLNGSFTTVKKDPSDLDLVVFFRGDTRSPEDEEQVAATTQYLQGADMKAEFDCDAYPVLLLPEDHPDYATITRAGLHYWLRWFAKDRAGDSKGRVWATLQGLR
jgi:hypothetical protein